jgi:hypothetical protein
LLNLGTYSDCLSYVAAGFASAGDQVGDKLPPYSYVSSSIGTVSISKPTTEILFEELLNIPRINVVNTTERY